jgi:hypothetical protein
MKVAYAAKIYIDYHRSHLKKPCDPMSLPKSVTV